MSPAGAWDALARLLPAECPRRAGRRRTGRLLPAEPAAPGPLGLAAEGDGSRGSRRRYLEGEEKETDERERR